MEISHVLARLLGIMMVVIYGGYFLNQNFYKRFWQNIADLPIILFLSGFIGLLCGLIIIQFHNVWTLDWKILITLFGWMLILSGIARIVFPQMVLKMAQKLMENSPNFVKITVGIMLLIGLFLTYKGFLS